MKQRGHFLKYNFTQLLKAFTENLIKLKKFIIKNNINIQDKEFMIMEF
jgi:hypothetical protein